MTMRSTRLLLILVPLLAACAPRSAAPSAPAVDYAARSETLADRFQSDLQTQLKAAIASEGAAGAVDICSQVAPAIAAELSEESGADVRRLALRERNPAARATGEMRAALEALADASLGPDGTPAVRSWTSNGMVHWVRAVPMQAQPCSLCHGDAIAPDVAARIAALYPQDRATGFQSGALRGAIAISWPAP
jgi:hypothetical protein